MRNINNSGKNCAVVFWEPAVVLLLSIVVSLTCTVRTLVSS